MVYSERLSTVDPCLYRQGFTVDSCFLPDTFSHDGDLLARALHTTVTDPHTLSPSSAVSHPSSTHTNSSNFSGAGVKRKRDCLLTVSGGKATTKSRSRASKKSQTTFITADPSNFRQMVQQVTGAKYNDDTSSVSFAPIFKPEPLRIVNRLPCGPSDRSIAVPTLDTSAFLSNHHQENLVVGNAFSGNGVLGLPSVKSNATVVEGGSAVEFDTYLTFPTLESWKVM